jgi:hypothetical protein
LAIAKAEGRFEEQGWRVRKDGSRFWANITLTAIKNEKDKPNGFLKIKRDLTAQKQAEEQRVQLAHEQAARIVAEVAKEKAETAPEIFRQKSSAKSDPTRRYDGETEPIRSG